VHDERRVTECIIILSAEPGDNTLNETYNGLPFEVENRWQTEVPRVGMFCTTYQTKKHGGSLALRLPLARALLMPGKGRWKGEKGKDLYDPNENPDEFDEQVEDWEKEWTLDADGTFLRKEELEIRMRRARAAAEGAVDEILALTKEQAERGGKKDGKKGQQEAMQGQEDMVAMSLQFMRKIKRPKAKRDAALAKGAAVDEKTSAELDAATAEHKVAIGKKLSAAGVRWKNLSNLVRSGSGGGNIASVALRAARAAAAAEAAAAES
jgi:hypothetical protein